MSRLFAVHLLFNEVIVPEQEGNAPYGGDADECVDDAAQNGALSAEKPCDEIKLENADEAPVDAADNGQQQQNLFEYGHKNPSLYASMARWGGIYT